MKIGFIGAGKMGGAILKGLLDSGFAKKEDIVASEFNEEFAQKVSKEYGVKAITDNNELVKSSDVVIVCTKPFVIKEVLAGVKDSFDSSKLVISIAAGISSETIEGIIGQVPVVRVMPNTPAFLAQGMTVLAKGRYTSDAQLEFAREIFSKVGKATILPENLIDAATGISGSGPAFFYLVIEALAQGGQKLGLDADVALELAAQTAVGAAEMIMQTGKTPELLRKEVTTPGGCTAVGLEVLDKAKVVDVFVETVRATAQKATELGK